MQNIAHRGLTDPFFENTIKAIAAAWEAKVDAVEIDVRRSRDKRIILFHDDKVGRQQVNHLTLDELNQLVNEIRIPTLSDLFNIGEPSGYYLLDLKDKDDIFVDQLTRLVQQSQFPKAKLIFQSDDWNVLTALKQSFPDGQFCYLARLKPRFFFTKPSVKGLLDKMQENDVAFISLKDRLFIDENFIRLFRDREISVFVWTINNPVRMEHYIKANVNGIITDVPVQLKFLLQGKAK